MDAICIGGDSMDNRTRQSPHDDRAHDPMNRRISRRAALKGFGAAGLAAFAVGALDTLAWTPDRVAHAAPLNLPNIQFDIGPSMPPARAIDGVLMALPPVYTLFITARLTRTPSKDDQRVLAAALDAIEAAYPFSPNGVFAHISYGLPYFNRLPGALVAAYMPLFKATGAAVLQESVPGPTDVSPLNPAISKQTFNIPVAIEANDVLLTLRGDAFAKLARVVAWLEGSGRLGDDAVASPAFNGLFTLTSTRVMFTQIGLPRKVAHRYDLPYAGRINHQSSMWMGFFSQQANGFGPVDIATFQGNSSAQFTVMPQTGSVPAPSDYFYDGAIQVLAHDILDLGQWYADDKPYAERAQLMFRSNPAPSTGDPDDQYRDGGGPAALPNMVVPSTNGVSDAQNDATANARLGHLQALQRATRAPDGTIVPQRVDGPGFDAMDVPDGSRQPKLQFSVFLPSAQNFAKARLNAGAPDLSPRYVPPSHNGIEPFMTATRRQNFLCPPRAHRAFPLLELT